MLEQRSTTDRSSTSEPAGRVSSIDSDLSGNFGLGGYDPRKTTVGFERYAKTTMQLLYRSSRDSPMDSNLQFRERGT